MNRAIKIKLSLLKSIKPRPEWASSTRDILLSQIKAQGAMTHEGHSKLEPAFVYTKAGIGDVYRYTLGLLFASPRNAFVTLFLLVGTSVGLSFASESSIPGNPLYSVKKTRETLASVAVSPEARAQFEADRAARRLEEFRALEEAAAGSLSAEEKEQTLAELAQDATETFAAVDHSLESLKKANEPRKLVAVAQSITEKADAARKMLDDVNVPPTREETLARVTDKIDETSRRALSVLVEKKDSAGIPEDTIADTLSQKLKEAEDDLAAFDARVSASALSKDGSADLVEKSDRAKRMLSEAQALLLRKDFKIALERLNESKALSANLRSALRSLKGDADVKVPKDSTKINSNKDKNTRQPME